VLKETGTVEIEKYRLKIGDLGFISTLG